MNNPAVIVFAVVVALTVAAHFAFIGYLVIGGFLAWRWPRTIWLHMPVVVWGVGSIAMGVLAGKYLGGAKPAGARLTKFPDFGERYQRDYVAKAAEGYVRVAREAGLDPAAMALAFVRSRPFVATTILGATSVPQLEQNIAGASLVLDEDVLRAIDAVHVRYPSPSAGL